MDAVQELTRRRSTIEDDNHESFSQESIAEEVQDLNPDVINEEIRYDDIMGTAQLERNLSRPNTNKDDDEATTGGAPLERRRTSIANSLKRIETINKIKKFSWWDDEFKKERAKVYMAFFRNYLILSVILVIILSVYWGSYYQRDKRYKNFRFLVVNQDTAVNNIRPLVGLTVEGVANNSAIKEIGTWIPGDYDRDEIIRKVHDQHYWGAIYVRPNVSYEYYEAVRTNDTSFNVTENLVEVIYETGRDYLAMNSYVIPFLKDFEKAFIQGFKLTYPVLLAELPQDSADNAISFLAQPPTFYYYDHRPVKDSVIQAPLQLGLTYLVLFAFFQFVNTIKIQLFIASKVKGIRYILLRMCISHVAYTIISLSYVVLNICFKLPYNATFGHSGFLVLWGIAYLTMASLGGLNENVALLCFAYFQPLIGGWLVLLMAMNIAPTVSPMALMNHFYRYGYALPIHNSYDLVIVVFCNTYKGHMGRNIGIMIAWIVASNLALPFTMIHVSKRMRMKAEQEQEQKNKELAERAAAKTSS